MWIVDVQVIPQYPNLINVDKEWDIIRKITEKNQWGTIDKSGICKECMLEYLKYLYEELGK